MSDNKTMPDNKVKRVRRSFEQIKADNIKKLEDQLKEAEAKVEKIKAEIETEKAKQPKARAMSEKAKTKKLAELLAKSDADEDRKRKALTLLGISDTEGLL